MQYVGILLISSFFLSPDFLVIPGLPKIRVEDFVLLFYFSSIFLTKLHHQATTFFVRNRFSKLLIYYAYFAIFSILLQELYFNNALTLNDFMVFPMLLKYLLIIHFFQEYGIKYFNLFINCLIIAGLLSVFIGIAQYHNFLSINSWLTPLYTDEELKRQIADGILFDIRIIGTHGDPRHFGYMVISFLSVLIALMFYKHNLKSRIMGIAFILSSLYAIILTVSRTTLLSLTLIVCLSFILYYHNMNKSRAVFSILLLSVLLIISYNFLITSYFERRVLSTDTQSFERSRYARIRDLRIPFQRALDNPLQFVFGVGPAKAHYRTDSHNDFGWTFQRFGIPGLLIYLSIFYFGLRQTIFGYNRSNHSQQKFIYFIIFMNLSNWVIFAMAENIFKNPQLMTLNMIFLGLLVSNQLENGYLTGSFNKRIAFA